MYSTPSFSKSHFVAASAPGYSLETMQLRKSWTPPAMGSTSGVVCGMARLCLSRR